MPTASRPPGGIPLARFLDDVFAPQRLRGRQAAYVRQYREAVAWLERMLERGAVVADLSVARLRRLQVFVLGHGFGHDRAATVKKQLSSIARFAWRLGYLDAWQPTPTIAAKQQPPAWRNEPPPAGTLAAVLRDIVQPRLDAQRAADPRPRRPSMRNTIAAAVRQFDDHLERYATPADLTDDRRVAFRTALLERGLSFDTARSYWRSLRRVAREIAPQPPRLRIAARTAKPPRGPQQCKIVLPPPKPGSVREFAERVYLPERCFAAHSGHVEGVRRTLRFLYDFAAGDVLLAEFDNATAAGFLQWLLKVRCSNPTTVNNHRARLFAVVNLAADRGLAQRPKVRKLKAHRDPPDAWSEAELLRILDAAERFEFTGARRVPPIGGIPAGKLWVAMLLTFLHTALRAGSILRLDLADVDFAAGTLTVNGRAVKTKKGQRFRLGEDCLAALADIRQPDRRRLFPFPEHDTRRRRFYAHFKRILATAGIPVGPRKNCQLLHKLRRSTATLVAIKRGVHAASELLGHSSIEQTLRYIDRSKLPDRDVTDCIPSLLRPSPHSDAG